MNGQPTSCSVRATIFGIISLAGLWLSAGSASAQTTTIAFDDAANSAYSAGDFDTGYNGGSGFGAWTLNTPGGGHYVGGSLFGLWNNAFGVGTGSFANRSFASALSVGQTFSISLENGNLNGADEQAGFNLEDSSGDILFSYWQQGGNSADGNYLDANGAGVATGFAYDFSQLDTFAFTLNSATSYTFTDLATSASLSGILSGAAISQIQIFRQNLPGDPNNGGGGGTDYRFNNLEITSTQPVPEPSAIAFAGIGGIGILFMARRRLAKF